MLQQLLKTIAPQQIAEVCKSNPYVVLSVLQNFKTFQNFGATLTEKQQLVLSSNLGKVDGFFLSKVGKDAMAIAAEEFVTYVDSLKPVELHNNL